MARPRIVEKDYFQFQRALKRAMEGGRRIEKTEADRWKAWVKEHRIKEAAFKSFGANMYEDLEPVIIDEDNEWGGYYLYSRDEEVVLAWERDPD